MVKYFRAFGMLCAVLACAPAHASDAPKGSVMLAKAQPNVILIWDATPAVVDLVKAETPPEDALRALEADAVGIMTARAKGASAHTLSVRVVYQHIAAVNPAYASATLQGLEKLFTLEASRDELARNGHLWKEQLVGRSSPKGLTVTVTGKLPGQ